MIIFAKFFLINFNISLTKMDKLVNVRELVINPLNPRTITEFMQEKLTQSLLLSPWMMAIFPIKTDAEGVIWSGNARCKSLRMILEMDEETIEDMLTQQTIYRNMTGEQQKNLILYWKGWQEKPEVPCRDVSEFTEDEKRELLFKENIHNGEDDPEMLRKFFDRDLISDFFGSVSWDLYDYADKINDVEAGKNKTPMKTFKCGYVEFFLTDSEYESLERLVEEYKTGHGDKTDGFLAWLLGDLGLQEAILYGEKEDEPEDEPEEGDSEQEVGQGQEEE